MASGNTWFMSVPGVGSDFLETFICSTIQISLSAPTSITGTFSTFGFDWFSNSSGIWTTQNVIVSGSQINSGLAIGGSTINGGGAVDGLRPNVPGSWTGWLKVCLQIP
jgi:hypothetical protein